FASNQRVCVCHSAARRKEVLVARRWTKKLLASQYSAIGIKCLGIIRSTINPKMTDQHENPISKIQYIH
ncbi:MAG: hypothetical protein PVH42_04205, partial [Desulfobacterales bacterium]